MPKANAPSQYLVTPIDFNLNQAYLFDILIELDGGQNQSISELELVVGCPDKYFTWYDEIDFLEEQELSFQADTFGYTSFVVNDTTVIEYNKTFLDNTTKWYYNSSATYCKVSNLFIQNVYSSKDGNSFP